MTSCLLSWRTKCSQKGSSLKTKNVALMGANSFLYEMTTIFMGCNKENSRVAFL